MKERIQRILDYYNLSIYAFSQKIGISDGTIRKILSENTTIRSDNLVKISQNFPDINLHWLLTGQGEMLRTSPAPSQPAPQPLPQPSRTLPLIPSDAIALLPSTDNIGIAFPDCQQYLIPELIARGADYLVRASGSSMYPLFSNGDLLACQIVHTILFFQWGKIYVIDSSQGVLVKRIFQSDNSDHIRLVSDNRDNYPPFDFPTSDIRSIAIVVGVIRLE